MGFNRRSRDGGWWRRRRFGAVLGLALMLVDLAGAAAMRPPAGEAARLLADTRLVCTLGGMRPSGQPADAAHFFCVFCLPLAHAASTAAATPAVAPPPAVGGDPWPSRPRRCCGSRPATCCRRSAPLRRDSNIAL